MTEIFRTPLRNLFLPAAALALSIMVVLAFALSPIGTPAVSAGNAAAEGSPRIIQIEIISDPARGDTYGGGETIEIEATFSTVVSVDGSPALGLWVGDAWQSASYLRGSGSNALIFGYTVLPGDFDVDGIKMDGGYADDDGNWHNFLNHDAVTSPETGRVAERAYTGFDDQPGHEVHGNITPVGTKTEIVSEPKADGVYRYGESIDIALTLTAPVEVTGSKHLNLRVGDGDDNWRGATYKSGSGTNTLTFSYTVQTRDLDEDGITVESSYTKDNTQHGWGGSGTVTVPGTDVVVPPNFTGLSSQEGHEVDGRPHATDFSFTSTPKSESDTYGRGEIIQVEVSFGQSVTADEWAITFIDMDSTRGEARYASGNGTEALMFEYEVQEDDFDTSGVSATLPQGQNIIATGSDVFYNAWDHGDGNELSSSAPYPLHKVDSSLVTYDKRAPGIIIIRFAEHPGPGDDYLYRTGDWIGVEFIFDESVVVTGNPQATIAFNMESRQFEYNVTSTGERDPDAGEGPNTTVTFGYVVQEGDQDLSGLSISENVVTLNGGTIQDEAGNDADLSHTYEYDNPEHRVDGEDVTPPSVESIAFSDSLDLPTGDDTYGAGDWLGVLVTFDEEVVVTGAPRMGIEIGDNVRQAEAWHLPDFLALSDAEKAIPVRVVFFGYTVQEGESDSNGISVAGDSITLNGGTIRDEAGNNAELAHEALADDPGHKVDAPDVTGPAIATIAVSSDPGSDRTYGTGSEIDITVTFDEAVVVTGPPQLELDMYDSEDPTARQAAYNSDESSGTSMVFTYTVVAGDKAGDGLEIPANALTLNGGTIQDGAGNNADLLLAQYGPDADHLVDGAGGV